MRYLVHRVNQALSGFSGWLMVAMMLLLVADFMGRRLNMPLQAMAELSVFVMMIVVYLGYSRCEEHNEHVGLEIVLNLMPAKARLVMMAISQALAVATIALYFYAVTTDALSAFVTGDAIEGTVELPIWPTKFVMVVGMVVFLLQGIINLQDAIGRLKRGDGAHLEGGGTDTPVL